MTLKVRRYQEGDADAVWRLHKAALAGTGADMGDGDWVADLRNIEEAYLRSGGEFLVGLHGPRIVAMGALHRTAEGVAEVKRMRVHPEFQGRGFGQAILEALERRARELGYTTLWLMTTTLQAPAQRLYERNGYREARRTTEGPYEVIVYEKRLGPEGAQAPAPRP